MCIRLKKNGKDAKEISQGFQGKFKLTSTTTSWYLPFCNPKQAHDMLAKKEMSDEPWTVKRDEIKAEHLLERALAELRMGWKAWITEHWSGKEGAGAAAVIPGAGIT
jgi:hypothetical protein